MFQTIKVLPPKLVFLKFGNFFNQPIDGLLPPTLTEIHFGKNFNHPLSSIPPYLDSLTLLPTYPHDTSLFYSSVLFFPRFHSSKKQTKPQQSKPKQKQPKQNQPKQKQQKNNQKTTKKEVNKYTLNIMYLVHFIKERN